MTLRAAALTGFCAVALLATALGARISLEPSRVVAATLPDQVEDNNAPTDASRNARPPRVAAQGRIEPVSEKFELAIGMIGPLAGVYVDEGDSIKKDQLLA